MRRFFDYEPTPFYFLNDVFDKEEILRQLDCLKENGIKSVFLHVRDGNKTEPWGTDRFYENMRFIIEEAIKREIKTWLYDEDAFPSGQAGGKIVIDRPELAAYGLKVKKATKSPESNLYYAVLGKVKGICGYAVKRENGKERVRILENCFGPIRPRWYRRDMTKAYYSDMADLRFNHIRAVTCYTEIAFEAQAEDGEEVYFAFLQPTKTDSRFGAASDCLNAETTKEYIQRIHEKYKKFVGQYFGKEIAGIFLDEPSLGGGLPYTAELPKYFKKRNGYEFIPQLYKLCAEYTGESAAFRRDYVKTTQSLFVKNFVRPIARWCKDNDLLMTGHFCSEEDPLIQALCCNDVYDNVCKTDIPGFDVITTYLGDVKHPSLIFGANLVASAAAHGGKNRVMAECFALSPFNMGYNGLKRCTDWLVACGINMIVPHGFHYGYNAYQRADAGKSFFFQDPLFNEYPFFSGYAGRLCKIITEYERANDTLVIIPDGVFAEEIPFPIGNSGIAPSERAVSVRNRLFEAIRYLFTRHTGFDLAETGKALTAPVINGRIKIGCKRYANVIVIKGGEQEKKTYDALKGRVKTIYFDGDCANIETNDNVIPSTGTENLLVYEKKRGKDCLTFIFNNSAEYIKFNVKVKDNTVVYDAEKDVCERLNVKDGQAELSLQRYGSIILECAQQPFAPIKGEYKAESDKKVDFNYLTDPQLIYMPVTAKQAITRYRLTVRGKFGEKTFNDVKFDRVRNYLGTQDDIYKTEYVVPYMDTAKRPEKLYPVYAEYTAKIEGVYKTEKLLFDADSLEGECEIYFNGKKIERDTVKKCRVYDVHNYAIYPEWKDGKNEIKFVFAQAGEFDGVGGEIYVCER